ncbi:MAG: carbohydrate-binding family 9-like protein [Gemmatimonadetes bacterium]|nr:carbohydrate-binding family 9-like protein [Gemmatimonadota bacterium]
MTSDWGYSEEGLKHYTACRTIGPLVVDGRLDEPSWQHAVRSPRFEDLEEPGRPGLFDTRAAVLWDDDYLYVGFWVEDPDVRATYTERDSMICEENDVEVFIAGKDSYYEFELNPLGTIMERFYVWQNAYVEAGFGAHPEFDLQGTDLVDTLGGIKTGHAHPRGRRWAFRQWDMPGMKWAVHVDGTINDPTDRDRGWTAEIAFPWQGLKHLADGRSLPAREGDTWRMDFSRFQWIDEGGFRTCPGWAWNSHGIYDSHIPDRFSVIHFSENAVGEGEPRATTGEPQVTSGEPQAMIDDPISREEQEGVIGSTHPAAATRTVQAEQTQQADQTAQTELSSRKGLANQVARYRCRRTRDDLVVDGDLGKETWALAERSRLFSDHSGARALFDTTAAMAWDDRSLYIGFWLEDRDIQATQEESTHEVREDSHVGVLVTGPGAYYDLAVNPLGATSEMCYIWKEAHRDDDRFHVPEFDLAVHQPEVQGGHTRTDIRAMRWAFSDWRLPGLQAGVKVDGEPGRRDRVDRGWTVELALPWASLKWLATGQAAGQAVEKVAGQAAPAPGDVWRIGLLRRQVIDQRGHRWQATWTLQPLVLVDGRMPETHLELELAD